MSKSSTLKRSQSGSCQGRLNHSSHFQPTSDYTSIMEFPLCLITSCAHPPTLKTFCFLSVSLHLFRLFRFISFWVDSDFCCFASMQNNRKLHFFSTKQNAKSSHSPPFHGCIFNDEVAAIFLLSYFLHNSHNAPHPHAVTSSQTGLGVLPAHCMYIVHMGRTWWVYRYSTY